MLIDVSELFSNKKSRKEIDLELEKDELYFEGELIKFSKPVKLTFDFKTYW